MNKIFQPLTDQSITLSESGDYEVILTDVKLDLALEILADVQVTCVFKLLGQTNEITLTQTIGENSSLLALFWNETANTVKLLETTKLLTNASYQPVYGDLSTAKLEYQLAYALIKPGASVKANCALLAQNLQSVQLSVEHLTTNTVSDLANYGIVLPQATYNIEVSGHISNGAKQSSAHQTSRVLTIGQVTACHVLPQLLIDENEVEASHAASIGQIDPEQLYYLQSRGLSEIEAIRLIASGYLMPIAEAIPNEQLASYLKTVISEKVADLCLM